MMHQLTSAKFRNLRLCNPFRVEFPWLSHPRVRSLRWRPWATVCNAFGVKNLRPERFLAPLAVLICFTTAATHSPLSFAVEFIEIIEEKAKAPNQNRHGFRIENFDQWIFQNQMKGSGARGLLEERLKVEVESIQSTFHLTEDQKDKLALAGLGDIQSFMQLYAKTRSNFEKNMHDQQAMQNIWREIQPLQKKYRGQIFGKESLFNKVLKHLLDKQQLDVMQQLLREQSKFQYQAAVMQLISQIDQVAPITHAKREQLLVLIAQYTFPPKIMPGSHWGHYFTYYVFGQLAEIPEDQLRPLFGKAAWKTLRDQIKQGKRMKRNLEQQGLVPDKGE